MAHSSKIIGALVLLCASAGVHAYVFPEPPPGFSGTAGNWKYAPTVPYQSFGRVTYTPAGPSIPLGGQRVTMPASFKWAANAGRVAAGFVFANPGIRFAAGVAGWLGLGALVWDEAEKVWRSLEDKVESTNGKQYRYGEGPWGSQSSACAAGVAALNVDSAPWVATLKKCGPGAEFTINWCAPGMGCTVKLFPLEERPSSPECPAGWTSSPAGCLSPAVPQPQFEDILAPKPMPDSVPFELPQPSPLPVETPWINPEPGPNPVTRPRFVPTGDPVANPQYNPELPQSETNKPFIQPGYRIVPSPTVADPWRVDVQPVNRPVDTAEPQPEVDEGPGQSNPGDKPREDVPGLCDVYPDILACSKLDTPDGPDLPESEKEVPSITPDSGWGADNASCPAPRMLTVQGQQIAIPYDIFCQYMSGLRPIIIAMAWLSAGFILIGARGGD